LVPYCERIGGYLLPDLLAKTSVIEANTCVELDLRHPIQVCSPDINIVNHCVLWDVPGLTVFAQLPNTVHPDPRLYRVRNHQLNACQVVLKVPRLQKAIR
jgi:hypothetical protein